MWKPEENTGLIRLTSLPSPPYCCSELTSFSWYRLRYPENISTAVIKPLNHVSLLHYHKQLYKQLVGVDALVNRSIWIGFETMAFDLYGYYGVGELSGMLKLCTRETVWNTGGYSGKRRERVKRRLSIWSRQQDSEPTNTNSRLTCRSLGYDRCRVTDYG